MPGEEGCPLVSAGGLIHVVQQHEQVVAAGVICRVGDVVIKSQHGADVSVPIDL